MDTYRTTFTVKRLWWLLGLSMFVMFGALLYFGREIYHQAPPIPESVQTTTSEVIYTRADIERGQNVWQSTGGMQQGSLWGHGGYLAPDWSADWLHREAEALLASIMASQQNMAAVNAAQQQEMAKVALRLEMRKNTYDAANGVVAISPARAEAVRAVAAHYARLFQASDAEALALRKAYAFPLNAVLTDQEAHAIGAFFFWTAWSAVTERPGDTITYTSNWPHEPLVGNTPTASVLMWSIGSVILLLAGIGALVWYYARQYAVWRA
jgi:nitric oxide reductase subunit B